MSRSFVPAQLICLSLAISAACIPDRIGAQTPSAAHQLSAEQRAAKLAERDRLWKEAGELRTAGKFDEALERSARNIVLQRELFGPMTVGEADAWEQTALIQRDQQHWAEARTAAAGVLAIRQHVHGKDDWRTTDARLLVADMERWSKLSENERTQLAEADQRLSDMSRLSKQGKYREAIPLAEQALALRRQVLGDDHRLTGSAWNSLGFLHHQLRDLKRAEPAYRQASEIWKKASGETHPLYAVSLYNLAALYESVADYAQAELLYKQSLEIRKQTLGVMHSDYAGNLNDLAELYRNTGDYARAEPLLRQASEIFKNVLGETHPHFATSLHNLALLYGSMGDYARAEPLLKQASEIMKQAQGETHPDYASSLLSLASLYRSMGDYARAEPLLKQASGIFKQALGARHPKYAASLNSLAMLYSSSGDYARAEPLYRLSLEINKNALGETHPAYATSLSNLAELYRNMGDYARAEPLCKQVLEIRKKVLGETHPAYATGLNNLAELYRAMRDDVRAEPLLRQALEINKNALGETHPEYATSLNNLAELYRNMGDYPHAEPLFKEAIEIEKKALGETHPQYATSLNNLGGLYFNTGDYARAEPLCKQVLEIRRKALGETHPDYALSLNNLAILELTLGRAGEGARLLRSAVEIQRRGLDLTGAVQSERQQLAMTSQARVFLDMYISAVLATGALPGELYAEVAAWKGSISAQQQLVRAGQRALAADPNSDVARLFAELEQKTRKLASLYGYTPKPEEAEKAQQTMRSLSESVEALQGKLSQLDPEFHRTWAKRSLSSDALRHILPTGTALVDLLEYDNYSPPAKPGGHARSERRYVAFILRNDKLVACTQLGPAQPINDLVDAWREGFGLSPARDGKLPGNELRRLLWVPIAASLAETNITLISPDSVLARLPWTALPGDRPGSYLIEERTIAVVPVPQRLPETLASSPSDGESSLLLVGNVDFGAEAGAIAKGQSRAAEMRGGRIAWSQLAGTKTEIDELKALFSRRFAAAPADVLEEKNATEDGLRRAAGAHRYLHLATHGFFASSEVNVPPPKRASQTSAATADRSAPTTAKPGRLGVKVEMRDGRCTVTEVVAGAAAAIDGRLQEADELVAISTTTGEWYQVAGNEVSAILATLRGPAGSEVRLKVRHHDKPDQEVELVLKRTPMPGAPSADTLSGSHPSLLSGIVLAGANRPLDPQYDDGILTAFEVSELNLEHVELVTLSACETGLGQSAEGEGLLGLQRAFQIAGAKTVIAGLWKVPDQATQVLMSRFYDNLWQKRMSKVEALREAQLWMLREGGQPNGRSTRGLTLDDEQPADAQKRLPPYYWAAFVLSGDWR